jgi:hypothetical protein
VLFGYGGRAISDRLSGGGLEVRGGIAIS